MTSEQRVRNRNQSDVTDYCYSTPWPSGSPVTTFGPYLEDRHLEQMTDVVTDRFHERIRDGEIINNPCNYTKEKHTTSGSAWGKHTDITQTWGWIETGLATQYYYSLCNKAILYANCPYPSLTGASEQDAKLRALSNMDTTPYAFGEDVLEIRETMKFLRRPLSSLLDLGTSFQHAYRRQKRKIKRKGQLVLTAEQLSLAHANVWLQYRFALMPLIRSTSDALEAYAAVHPKIPERLTARGFSKDAGTNQDSPGYATGGSIYSFDLTRIRSEDYHASILYTVSNPVQDLKWKLGFRAKDVPTTLWQVFPYSFMVDRMLDISSFSKAVLNLADPNVKILSASSRSKSETVDIYRLTDVTNPNYPGHLSGEQHTHSSFSYVRTPWSPSISDAIPRVKPKELVSDATKIADLAALILQRFAK